MTGTDSVYTQAADLTPEIEEASTCGQPIEVLFVGPWEKEAIRIAEMLGAPGDADRYVSLYADTTKSGLIMLGSGRFDIAFIDSAIGSESGIDLIRSAGGRLCPTPMVILTDRADAELEKNGFGAGAVDIVEKSDMSSSSLRRVVRYARFNHEMTRKLIVEEQRNREIAATAAAASGEKTKFLAHMSHELRTPLNAILGFSDVIRHEMFGKIEGNGADRYREYIRDIHDSSFHLLSLINDLLDLSKVEAGKLDLAPVNLLLGDVVADVRRMVQQLANDKDISLLVDLPDRPIDMFADRRLMIQVLLNVVSNAIKFTPQGGTVLIGAHAEGQNLVITVSDTGRGIAPEELELVLEPFQQAGPLETRPAGGTGLGLPLSRSIMELHGGGLEIESELGEGTTVSIWLMRNLPLLAASA